MVTVKIYLNQKLGKIKPMHAVGQPPMIGGFLSLDLSPINYLKEANIPYSRLYDVGGTYGGLFDPLKHLPTCTANSQVPSSKAVNSTARS